MGKGISEISQSTRVLAGRISRLTPGEVLTYDQIQSLIGDDPRDKGRSCLASARRIAERDHNVVTDTVTKEGIKRIEAGQIAGVGDKAIDKSRRASKRAVRSMLAACQSTPPTGDDVAKVNARVSVLGALAEFFTTRRVASVERAVVANNGGQLAAAQALAAFSEKAPQ